jgi:hypothetical protein
MKQNPKIADQWHLKTNHDKIAATAREISYGMTRLGAFQYQRGALGVTMQFLSVPHKAMLSILPEAMGGVRTFTPAEKIKIAGANFLNFGGYTFGSYKLIEQGLEMAGIELNEEGVAVVRGGVVDLGFNIALQTLFEEKSLPNVEFSASFSPFGEKFVPFVDTMVGFFEEPGATAFLGPFKTILRPSDNFVADFLSDEPASAFEGRVPKAARLIYSMMNSPVFETTEQYLMGADALLTVASGWSDYWKARWIAKHEKHISGSGRPGRATVTPSSDALAQLLGFGTATESATWDHMLSYRDEQKHVEQLVNQWMDVATLIMRSRELGEGADVGALEKQRLGLSMMWWVLDDRPDLTEMARKEIRKRLRFDTLEGKDNLLSILIDQVANGGEIAERTYNEIDTLVGAGAIPAEDGEAVKKMYRDWHDFRDFKEDTE